MAAVTTLPEHGRGLVIALMLLGPGALAQAVFYGRVHALFATDGRPAQPWPTRPRCS